MAKQPSPAAQYIGHALVGIAAAAVVAKVAKGAAPALFAALIAVVMHVKFDAPVSRTVSDFGI